MNQQSKIKLLVVDDHSVVRKGLRYMLEKEDDISIVAEASSAEEAYKAVEEMDIDVILMDIKMPGTDGIEAARHIKQIKPDINIIMLTLYDEYLAKALEAGAEGYLLKDVKSEELISAIRIVRTGPHPLSSSATQWIVKSLGENREKGQNLTERESDILKLIANGYSNKKIAEQLNISQATVKVHITRMFSKLGVRTRQEAALIASTR